MIDLVNKPPHYIGNGLEAIDVIEDWGLGFHLGNALKYIVRAGKKSKLPVEDLQKAIWYLERAQRQGNTLRAVFHAPMRTGIIDVAHAFGLSERLRCAVLHIHSAACYATTKNPRHDMIERALIDASDAVMAALAQLREAAA